MQLLKEFNSPIECECHVTLDKWTQNYRIRTIKVLVSIYVKQIFITTLLVAAVIWMTAIWPNKACPVLLHINTLFFYKQWKNTFLVVNLNFWTLVYILIHALYICWCGWECIYSYLHLSSMVSDDEPKEDDGRQADKTFQCQGIHGALQKHIT